MTKLAMYLVAGDKVRNPYSSTVRTVETVSRRNGVVTVRWDNGISSRYWITDEVVPLQSEEDILADYLEAIADNAI